MTRQFTRYEPGRRTYPAIPDHLLPLWRAIDPTNDGALEYRPCSATLSSGVVVPCVYIVQAQSYIDVWGIWPEDDRGKRSVGVQAIASISESPFRLPAQYANRLYLAGESGMGGTIFTVLFSDGSRQAYEGGNAIDFIAYPSGKAAGDIVDVIPHEGRDDRSMAAPEYAWCLFGSGEGRHGSLRFA